MDFETLTEDEARLYLIAHAPQTIPDWFHPTVPEAPKQLAYPFNKYGKNSGHEHEKLYRAFYDEENGWTDEGKQQVPEAFRREVDEYVVKFQESTQALIEWTNNKILERHIQWPIYWADHILSKLNP